MKVKRSSWHYRLWRFGRESPRSEPRDLCRYFWHLVLVKMLIPVAVVVGLIVGLVALVWVCWTHADVFFQLMAIFGAMAVMIGGLTYIGHRQEKAKKAKRDLPPEPPKEPGIVRSYFKARKQKVCPLIEVVDE